MSTNCLNLLLISADIFISTTEKKIQNNPVRYKSIIQLLQANLAYNIIYIQGMNIAETLKKYSG